MRIAFHQPHLSERGTSVAMFDYAFYNEQLLANESYIITQAYHRHTNEHMYEKFNTHFKIFTYNDESEIERIIQHNNIDFIYHIKFGTNDGFQSKLIPNLNHFVFECVPHGEKYAMVSAYLAKTYSQKYISHIVKPFAFTKQQHDTHRRAFREKYNIPQHAFVFGRHGGYETFSINYVKKIIAACINKNEHVYYIFLNTAPFLSHPRIIHINTIVDEQDKAKYIAACDAYIHAREDGETFGLAVAEFSVANKPVLTTHSFKDNAHIELLGSKAILYNEHNLASYLINPSCIDLSVDYNAYRKYTPEHVMNKFQKVFFGVRESVFLDKPFYVYDNDGISRHIYDGDHWKHHYAKLYKLLLNKNTVALDVGAHIGTQTVILSQICKTVHAYEPNVLNYHVLKLNTNKMNNVITHAHGLSNEFSNAISSVSTVDMINDGHKNTGDVYFVKNKNGDVLLKPLDDERHDKIDFIKLCTQGTESEFLVGADKTIHKHKPFVLTMIEEYACKKHGYTRNDVYDKFVHLGYVLYLVGSSYPVDYLCVPVDKNVGFVKKYEHNIHKSTHEMALSEYTIVV